MDCVKIYYLDIEKMTPHVKTHELELFLDGKVFNSDKRRAQYLFGRFLVKFGLKEMGISSSNIFIRNNKPCLENNEVYFSISHSKNIVMVAFSKNNIGVDVEFMRERDFSKIYSRYALSNNCHDKIEFYKFWTKHESEIKLQEKVVSSYSSKFLDNYFFTIAISEKLDIKNNIEFKEITNDDFIGFFDK